MTEPRIEDQLETCWGRTTMVLQAICTHPSACKAASRCLATSSERGNVQPERKVPRRDPILPDLEAPRRVWPVPLQIYDVPTDKMREATQKDIDDFMRLGRAYGQLREALKRMMVEIEEIHARLISQD